MPWGSSSSRWSRGGCRSKERRRSAIANKHKTEPPPVPRKLAPQIPEGLSKLILHCLEKDKAKRYQTTEELLADLDAIEQALPTAERIAPKRRTITHREVTVKFQPRKLLIPVLAVSALAAVLVFVWRSWSDRTAFIPPPKIENSIAIVSLGNQTGNKENDSLCQRSLANLLATNLENTEQFYVATWERMGDVLRQMGKKDVEVIDSKLGFEICRKAGIAFVVTGDLISSGEAFVIDLKVWDAETRRLHKALKSTGRGKESILETQVDDLSTKICEALGVNLEKIGPKRLSIAGITTSSMDAYEHFLKGQGFMQEVQLAEAKASLEKAIELDPSFATAYLELSRVVGALGQGDWKARQEALIKAKEFSGHASEKEKLFIEASFASGVEGDAAKTIRILENIVSRYPQEKEGHYRLGRFLSASGIPSDLRDVNRGIKEMEEALELDPNWAELNNMLGLAHLDLGHFEKAIGLLKNYASLSPGNANPIDSTGYAYYKWGKLDEAIRSFRKAIKIKSVHHGTYWSIAYTYALMGDYEEAMGWIDRLVEKTIPPAAQVETFQFRGFLNLWLGRFEQSLLDFKKAEEINESTENKELRDNMDYWRCILYLEKGDFDLSRQNIQRWLEGKTKRDDFTFFKILEAYSLGLIDMKQGKPESAKKQLEVIEPLIPEFGQLVWGDYFGYLRDILNFEIGLSEGKADFSRVLQAFGEDRAFLAPWSYLWNNAYVIRYLNSPPFVRDFIPRAYLLEGEVDKAIAAYERLITFNPQSQDRRLVHPLNYYRLGKLYEQKGNIKKAKINYHKFLDLWKDADPGLPEVADAKKRLAAL